MEQWKMKNAYNFAYVQRETFNFAFAQQAVIVYFYLSSIFQEITMPNATVTTVVDITHS